MTDSDFSIYTSPAASSTASSPPTSLSNSPSADMGSDFICLSNVQVLESDASISQRPLYIDQSTGSFLAEHDIPPNAAVQVMDMQNKLVAPGLIDVQVNGALGFDFSIFDPSHAGIIEYEAGIRKVAQAMLKHGVTSFLPTVITQKGPAYHRILRHLRPRRISRGANILGWHCEGPFLSPKKPGCHDTRLVRDARDKLDIIDFYGLNWISDEDAVDFQGMITIAPEVPGVLEQIPRLSQRGIKVSIGHTNATYDQATQAVKAGSTMITHLYNAMPNLNHKQPSVIDLLAAPASRCNRPFWSIVADGQHVSSTAATMAYRSHPKGCVLVTDCMALTCPNLAEGLYDWRDGRKLTYYRGRLEVEGTCTLAGSVAKMDDCVRNFARFADISLADAVVCASYNVAKMLGNRVDKQKGALLPGYDADLVVFDTASGEVEETWVAGQRLYVRAEQ